MIDEDGTLGTLSEGYRNCKSDEDVIAYDSESNFGLIRRIRNISCKPRVHVDCDIVREIIIRLILHYELGQKIRDGLFEKTIFLLTIPRACSFIVELFQRLLRDVNSSSTDDIYLKAFEMISALEKILDEHDEKNELINRLLRNEDFDKMLKLILGHDGIENLLADNITYRTVVYYIRFLCSEQ